PNEGLRSSADLLPGGQLVRDSRLEEASLQRQAEALRMLREHEDSEGDLLDLLARPERAVPARRVQIDPKTPNFHAANREVVELALGVDRIFMVQGPPGTGKTTVIAELISQILEREGESRVLL